MVSCHGDLVALLMRNMINGKYNFVILFELTDVLTSVTYNQFSIKEMLSTAIKFHF